MMRTYEEHPLSQLLPMMPDDELNELAEDIKQNGQRAPITLLDDKVLDGRNRYRACLIAGVEPRFKNYNGDGDPIAFIISANVRRRHLNESQRALIAAKLANMPRGRERSSKPFKGPILKPNQKVSQTDAAKELDVSRRTVQTAKKVLKEAPPEEVKKIERGEKTVATVAKETKAKANAEKPKERLDKTGYSIPESILFDWDRAVETSHHLLSKISGVRSELKKALEDQDTIFAEVTNTTIVDLNNAYTSLKCVVPYAVCTSCQGHNRKKCNLCKGRGFLSEFAWRSFVPSEVKKLRGAK